MDARIKSGHDSLGVSNVRGRALGPIDIQAVIPDAGPPQSEVLAGEPSDPVSMPQLPKRRMDGSRIARLAYRELAVLGLA